MKRLGLSFSTQQRGTALFGLIFLSVMSGQYPSLSQELVWQASWLSPACVFIKLFVSNLTLRAVKEARHSHLEP